MKTSEIYFKTMKFNFIKLGLGVLEIVIDIVILALGMGLGYLIKSETFRGLAMVVGGLASPVMVHFIIAHYIGYIVKAGHIAVMVEGITTGRLPDNQIDFAKESVKERFGSANVYFGLNSLISSAVRSIQSMVDGIGSLLSKIPGGQTIVSIVKCFLGIFLGYIDECCLGYTFYQKGEGAFKCGCDGVVIYFQNAKALATSAIKIVVITMISSIVIFWLAAIAIFGVLSALEITGFATLIGLVFLALIVATIETAFVKSYILISMMKSYMEVAPTTEITVDIYSKLCGVSRKFKKLFEKSQQQEVQNI